MPQARDSSRRRHMAVLALGANQVSSLGKPKETLIWAISTLSERVGSPIRKSFFYATPAFPTGSGPDFVNAAVAFETDLKADQLLPLCHELEADAGRTRDLRWGQRTLDIDLIAFDQVVLPDKQTYQTWLDLPLNQQTQQTPDQLIIPHPRVQDRAFVLVPMLDVAPDWTHPVLGLTVRQMLHARPRAEKAAIQRLDMA